MEITYLGHAAILVRGGGVSLLMDPWLEDPAYCNSWFHYPPLALRIEDVAPVDYVYCSHDHPDHFDPKTLAKLPRDQKFLVPPFTSGELARKLRREGFHNQIVLPFGEALELASDFEVTGLRTDLVWEDSAIVVRSGGTTLFNMNDCKLGDDLLREVGERYRPDIVFVPFSGAIHFPTCYDYAREQRAALCRKRRRKHLEGFVKRVGLLQAPRAVPFAGNFALLHRDQLWMNEPDQNNINTPDEAIALLAERRPEVEGVQMNPGDRWTLAGGLRRHAPPPDFARKTDEIRALAERAAPRLEALRAAEEPARASLGADVARYFARIAQRHPDLPPRIAARVVFVAHGRNGGAWCLDWSAQGLAIEPWREGEPWNLRLTLPASILQRAIDGAICWDEVAISFRVHFAENPERFNQDFWAMLYNNTPAFLDEYLGNPEPKFA
jgi:UDP-MurNAc hydroxylase